MIRRVQCCCCGGVSETHVTIHPLSWAPTGMIHFASCPLCGVFLEVQKPKDLHSLWHSEVANTEG